MNRHTKLAIVLAPFLSIGGYIAADYYSNYERQQDKLVQLVVQENCVLDTRCQFKNSDLVLDLAINSGVITLVANHSIDHAVVSVGSSGEDNPVTLVPRKNKRTIYWEGADTAKKDYKGAVTVRIFVRIGKAKYIAELTQ